MSEAARLLVRVTAGLVTASGGNLSARDPGLPGLIWITPASRFKGDLQPEHMANIGLDGEPRAADDPRPSTEWSVHCAMYRIQPDVWAVVHSHAPRAMGLALTGTRSCRSRSRRR